MEDRMYGVVLWADECDQKAVIWCEDHGNLAYYSAAEHNMHEDVQLDPGDLIQFELREEHDCRRASNLRRIDAGWAPNLPENLRPRKPAAPVADNVVAFPGNAR